VPIAYDNDDDDAAAAAADASTGVYRYDNRAIEECV
jgi:hypothetical protein